MPRTNPQASIHTRDATDARRKNLLPLPAATASTGSLANPLHLRDCLPYRLNQLVGVAGAAVIRWCEGRFGITRREWRLIATLATEGAMLSSDLARHLELDRARTSRALRGMEDKKLISRSATLGNRKHVLVTLSQQGEAVYQALWPLVREHHLHLLQGFNDDQVRQLDQLLRSALVQAQQLNASYADLPKAQRRLGGKGRARRADASGN